MIEVPAGHRTCLYDTAQMQNLLQDMAQQTAGLIDKKAKLAIVGVLRRGAPLADQLTNLLISRHGFTQPLRLDLSVKRYADDLTLLHPNTQLSDTERLAQLDLTNTTVLVVDDVLYKGHSLLRVTEFLAKKNPVAIRTACLVDRCTSALPIKADVVGAYLKVGATDIIECHVPPYEPDLQILLVQRAAAF
jgi:pyrimidine operon attenuation protein/uracil phosphoribosyltransferase